MEALILAGGLGTRLASAVSDRAKPVALIEGRPFLARLLDQLEKCAEITQVALCVGHKSETVESAVGARHGRMPIRYSREHEPLGTGGALRQALGAARREEVLAMNGDSFLGIQLQRLIDYHRVAHSRVTLALARAHEGARFGAAQLRGDTIVSFREKGVAGPAWINAGIYLLSPEAQQALHAAPPRFSFEQEMLVPWCAEGHVRGMRSRARFIDIGTPDDYRRAAGVLQGA